MPYWSARILEVRADQPLAKVLEAFGDPPWSDQLSRTEDVISRTPYRRKVLRRSWFPTYVRRDIPRNGEWVNG